MYDVVTLVAISFSGFFIVLSLGLLVRYREISRQLRASTDLGKDLWSALDSRLKKQDERILDVVGRLEVVQSRLTTLPMPRQDRPGPGNAGEESTRVVEKPKEDVTADVKPLVTQEKTSRITSDVTLDQTEITVLGLLAERPRSSVEVKELIGMSREHAARLMKALFEKEFVSRDDSKKPFVYQLTEKGRNRLPAA